MVEEEPDRPVKGSVVEASTPVPAMAFSKDLPSARPAMAASWMASALAASGLGHGLLPGGIHGVLLGFLEAGHAGIDFLLQIEHIDVFLAGDRRADAVEGIGGQFERRGHEGVAGIFQRKVETRERAAALCTVRPAFSASAANSGMVPSRSGMAWKASSVAAASALATAASRRRAFTMSVLYGVELGDGLAGLAVFVGFLRGVVLDMQLVVVLDVLVGNLERVIQIVRDGEGGVGNLALFGHGEGRRIGLEELAGVFLRDLDVLFDVFRAHRAYSTVKLSSSVSKVWRISSGVTCAWRPIRLPSFWMAISSRICCSNWAVEKPSGRITFCRKAW